MAASICQRRLFACRLIYLIIGPEAYTKLKLPWEHIVSKPLPREFLLSMVAPTPDPEEPEPEPEEPTPPEPPEPEPEPEPPPPCPPYEPEPTPPDPAPPTPPDPAPPYVPPPIYIAPWNPGPIIKPGATNPGPAGTIIRIVGSPSDGTIFAYGSSWSTVRNAPTNAYAWDNSTSDSSAMTARLFNSNYYIRRSFLFFDLSSLPAGKTINAVVVYVLGYLNATSNILLLQGTQNDPIQNADWGAFTGTGFANVLWTKKLAGQWNYNEMHLNAAGLAYIASCAGSTARFCLREYDHDALNVTPTDNIHFNGMFFADHLTPASRPFITIWYQ